MIFNDRKDSNHKLPMQTIKRYGALNYFINTYLIYKNYKIILNKKIL